MIKVNTSNISSLYVGQTEAERVYLGTEIVYERDNTYSPNTMTI